MRAPLRYAAAKNSTVRGRARAYLRGLVPDYWIDFVSNQVIWDGALLKGIADIPGLSGTAQTGVDGHLANAGASVLTFAGINIPAPFGIFLEANRQGDLGANETLVQLDSGFSLDCSRITINAADSLRPQEFVANTATYNPATGYTAAIGVPFRVASRHATNDCQGAVNGALTAVTTSITIPANRTTLQIGAAVSGLLPCNAYIRRLAIVKRGPTAAELSAGTLGWKP